VGAPHPRGAADACEPFGAASTDGGDAEGGTHLYLRDKRCYHAGVANVVSVILAGGQGGRPYSRTKVRSKPAVPIVVPEDAVIPAGAVI
jgi:hypothetical protein